APLFLAGGWVVTVRRIGLWVIHIIPAHIVPPVIGLWERIPRTVIVLVLETNLKLVRMTQAWVIECLARSDESGGIQIAKIQWRSNVCRSPGGRVIEEIAFERP